ncbi:MAG: hypothetical protein OQJ81_08975, partial [Melioribacteraceae bacterium]|nr:hypothetical protein [Melioribacteraceae bacterium]
MKIIIILFLLTSFSFGQTRLVNKDTSYTVSSTYNKLIEEYPFINSVMPILPDSVNAVRNINYINNSERDLTLDVFYKRHKS